MESQVLIYNDLRSQITEEVKFLDNASFNYYFVFFELQILIENNFIVRSTPIYQISQQAHLTFQQLCHWKTSYLDIK